MRNHSSSIRWLACYTWVLVACAVSTVHAQTFTTIYNVPPDTAPDAIGSNTQLNLGDGGYIPWRFTAGSEDGTSSNIEINVLGGIVRSDASIYQGTTLNISGGTVRNLIAYYNSVINITGGEVEDDFFVYDNSTVYVSGGEVGYDFEAHGNSTVVITGGNLRDVTAFGSSTVNISNGNLSYIAAKDGGSATMSGGNAHFYASSGGVVEITGGQTGNYSGVGDGGTINIRGGRVGGVLMTSTGGSIQLYGSEFRLDGLPIPGLNNPGDSAVISSLHLTSLTGTLQDGAVTTLRSGFEDNNIADGTITVNLAPTLPPGPGTINVPASAAPPGLRVGQTLNLSSGAEIPDYFGSYDAAINIDGGSIGEDMTISSTDLTITTGQIGVGLTSFLDSNILIDGGSVGDSLGILSGGYLRMTEGSIGDQFSLGNYWGSSSNISVDIEGGTIGREMSVSAGAAVNFSGGTFGDGFFAEAGSSVNFTGESFTLNGIDLTSAMTPGVPLLINERDGAVLAGVLADGTPFDLELTPEYAGEYDAVEPGCTLTITHMGSFIPHSGDLNADGFVGITDLNIILSSWNSNVTPRDLLAGDPSGDGYVGIEDLNLVLGNWNAGTPPTDVVTPEPASAAIVLFGMMAGALRRKRA